MHSEFQYLLDALPTLSVVSSLLFFSVLSLTHKHGQICQVGSNRACLGIGLGYGRIKRWAPQMNKALQMKSERWNK